MFTKYVQWRLERYVKKYFKKHHPTLIAIVGSVGKTTTKTALATVLARHYRVQLEPSNLNTRLSAPLAIMGVKYPPMELVHSPSTWRKVFKAMKRRVKADQGVDVIIQELGTDHPGDLATFQRYLCPDITVVTAVSPEHMENFPGGLTEVAKEELSMAACSRLTVISHDDVDESFAKYADTDSITDYGINGGEYRLEVVGGSPLGGYDVRFQAPDFSDDDPATTTLHLVGDHMLKAACAAMAIGTRMGIPTDQLMNDLAAIKPVSGRMNPLPGRRQSTLIDDTYNSSPIAAMAALETIYQIDTPQRIVILGSMNELGNYAIQAHQQVGQYCDSMRLDWVVTVGSLANHYLAAAAKHSGCQVRTFDDPVDAGTFVSQVLKEQAVVLIKGSQNEVYTEEATKILLRSMDYKDQLVRQSEYWLQKKQDWFAKLHQQTEQAIENE